MSKKNIFFGLFVSLSSLFGTLNTAYANFESDKQKVLLQSKTNADSIKKKCKKNVSINIDWDSFKKNTKDLIIISTVLKEIDLTLDNGSNRNYINNVCANLDQIKISSNKKTDKSINKGVLSLTGNQGSQTFTRKDFESIFEISLAAAKYKTTLIESLKSTEIEIKRLCEKNINFEINWNSLETQNRENYETIDWAVRELRNSFYRLRDEKAFDKTCESLDKVVFSKAKESSSEFLKNTIDIKIKDTSSTSISSSHLLPLLKKGQFKKQTEAKIASSQGYQQKSESKVESEVKKEASDLNNEAQNKVKSKLRDRVRGSLFKGF